MFNFYAKAFRLKNVQRWAIMRNIYTEDVSQHSFETALIANGIAVYGVMYYNRSYDVGEITQLALFHDITEAITGDMISPIKYSNDALRDAYKSLEKEAMESLMSEFPGEIRSYYSSLMEGVSIESKEVIKAADTIVALIKCMKETSLGNRDFIDAEKSLQKKLAECTLPEVQDFWTDHKKSFFSTLDSLKGDFYETI